MLPDSLLELFDADSADLSPEQRERRARIASVVHANQVQHMIARTAASRFAHANRLNLIDFQVLQTVVAVGDTGHTATPGYICQQLSLSASTLTSILERLANRGLLLRERDSADRRRISVYYTEESAALIMRYYQQVVDSYELALGTLSDEHISQRIDFLHELAGANQRLLDALESADPAELAGQAAPSSATTARH
ncbi:MarR family winged helix-turn-helix transcriptional regulator [Brevibacterium daeguense]|nr:MarR family winged helix-turn-helix transcriptional regulator [Brevibacterium daeguense]